MSTPGSRAPVQNAHRGAFDAFPRAVDARLDLLGAPLALGALLLLRPAR